ncbi:transmembrane 6 superfamily member 1-like [Mercenaria mercenaria]|uniref:transmembrane 6 superfamily member 1-like n=1 Tax=Mercenaria mercenaria TaxID=6596 RepID=UPI001E1D86AA|nr:transmembrane 6 superfamily member 1-like [Mercenaria mercenaria]
MLKPPIVLLVFLASFLAAPLIYSLDKLVMMENSKWVFTAGVITLPLFGLLCTIFVQEHPGKKETLYYVWCIFSFTAVVDLFIALELDGYVKGFMEFYLREGEPYLRSSYGTMINWWDGIGHFSMYLGMIYLLTTGQDYRLLGLYWVGSITHSMIVFMPGNVIGNKGLKWSYFLNVPYVFYPIYAGVRFLREGMRIKQKQVDKKKSSWEQAAEWMFAVWFLAAIVIAAFRYISCMGCKEKITEYYLKEIEPYLNDPTQYGRTQALCYFYYFVPFYVAAFCSLIYPGERWVKDWSLIHAGASIQAQLVFICSSLKWRTQAEFQVPDTTEARSIFWTVNLSLVIVPHLFALYCHRYEVREFFSGKVIPAWKSIQGEVRTSQKTTKKIGVPTRNGPVTRQQKKLM